MGADRPGLIGGNLYAHLGVASRQLGASTVQTTFPVDDAVLVAGGVRAAVFGIAMEHGVPLLARVAAVPVVISVHLARAAEAPDQVRVVTRIARQGRALTFTESTFYDREGPAIGFGAITWSASGSQPEGHPASRSAAPAPDIPTPHGILEAVGVQPLAEGNGCRMGLVSPEIAAPGGILHAGAVQLLCEEAALASARHLMTTADVTARGFVCHLLAAGRTGLFTARDAIAITGRDGVDSRIELRDEGNDGRLIATADVHSAMS